jgi:glutamate transport system permease protein
MLPSIISQLVVILKDSALGFLILYEELLRSGQTLASSKGNLIPTFLVIAVIFIVVNYTLTLVARQVERRLQRGKRGAKPPPADVMLNQDMMPAAAEVTAPSR